ncbi:protein translocase subunit SecD [uncultured Jatrophihabitans sp.]|uniref:protein translocase subunit SecD n=1 Tax=uncultured Jatrophihabitans sp. TaxID=1610747 RepID=UPI0035CC3B45
MAPPPGTLRVGRYFLTLVALMAVLYALVFLPGERHTPKLGIDLIGGRSVIFTAVTPNHKAPTTDQMNQARQIIENRVNGTGVTQATVVIEGGDRLNISIPGGTNTDVSALGRPANLNFRGLIAPAVQVKCVKAGAASGSSSSAGSSASSVAPTAAPSSTKAAPRDAGDRPLTAPTPSGTPTPATSGAKTGAASSTAASPTPSSSSAPTPTCQKDPLTELTKIPQLKISKIPTTETEYTALTKSNPQAAQYIGSALSAYDCSAAQDEADNPKSYYVACDKSGAAYLLGTVIVPGTQVASASAVAPSSSGQGSTTVWSVSLNLKDKGADSWADWTRKFNTSSTTASPGSCGASTATPCSDFVGFTLDGQVLEAPVTQNVIDHQATQITGGFVEKSATELAQQLNYGALPLKFNLEMNSAISATLGSAQLQAGLLAGGIGLILVVIYSLIYYRALGLVTIASLIVSGGLTYSMLVVLGKQIGFTLDLAGIAGFIVAIGITADSFVVFFERIKDEVHDGRSMRVAVPRAWVRARRTILSADTVSFLAAAILYYFAAGDVRGFAFTLGLSTILDLIVVFLFTHPIVSLLSRSRAFGSARFTGLNSVRAGGVPVDVSEAPVRVRGTARSRRGSTALRERPRSRTQEVENLEDDEPITADVEPETEPDVQRPDREPGTGGSSAPGSTAAERAAARRARLREQRGSGPADGGAR